MTIGWRVFFIVPSVAAICSMPEDTELKSISISSQGVRFLPRGVQESTRVLGNTSVACQDECLYSLAEYVNPERTSVLVVRHGDFVPANFELSNSSELYCARNEGVCGANMPLFRHFNLNASGLYHAYSFADDIPQYTKELVPLCWFWGNERTRRDTSDCSEVAADSENMAELVAYVNNETGTLLDHYYTTRQDDSSLVGYSAVEKLGKVLMRNESCGCGRTLINVFDNQTGAFHRRDYKLMLEGSEMNRAFEKYNVTGEKFYCAINYGDCGATVPLYKHFDFLHIDSMIATSQNEVPPYSYRFPVPPLCYIWASNYSSSLKVTDDSDCDGDLSSNGTAPLNLTEIGNETDYDNLTSAGNETLYVNLTDNWNHSFVVNLTNTLNESLFWNATWNGTEEWDDEDRTNITTHLDGRVVSAMHDLLSAVEVTIVRNIQRIIGIW